ncbi:MAG: hypothetical protein AAF569_02560 [Pseudomonadota bacterium]
MSVSADMYIVISLMFAVFAAVAAVGTSVVLGAGYERLRAGFEVIRKQTGFFADAIHKLDERTKELGQESSEMKSALSSMSQTVERVDKQTGFFADAIHNLEQKVVLNEAQAPQEQKIEKEKPLLPENLDLLTADSNIEPDIDVLGNMSFLNEVKEEPVQQEANTPEMPDMVIEAPKAKNEGLSKLLASYFRGGEVPSQEVTYH